MKRTIVILAAAAALAVSCQREEAMSPDSGASYSFNLNITGGGFSNGTRADATVGWTVGENVFLFFQPEGEGVLDRCLTLTYDGSSFHQSGSYIPYGKLGTGGKLSAVYVPYLENGVKPVYGDGGWTIDGGDVYYSCASGVAYTVSGQQVSATVAMSIPDGYVQFAVPATKAADGDMMSCNLVDAYDCVTLGADLTFTETPVEGKKMTGHKDGGNVFFWGKMNGTEADECELILASSVTGTDLVKKVDLHETAVAKNNAYKTDFIPAEALPGLFSISPTEKVHFSKGNLYCTDNGESVSPRYTFAFEEEQYQFHTRYGVTHHYLGKRKNEVSPEDIPGLIYKEGESGLFQWVSETAFYNRGIPDDEYLWFYAPTQEEIDQARQNFGSFSMLPIHELITELDGLPTDIVEFGKAYSNGKTWFTLSADEWQYLIGRRTHAEYILELDDTYSVDTSVLTSPCRDNAANLYNFPVTVNGVKGLLIAPDNWNFKENPITGDEAKTEYNDEEWIVAENSGLVFLPACGESYMPGNMKYLNYLGQRGHYWTRSAYDEHIPLDDYKEHSFAYTFSFVENETLVSWYLRTFAYSVRLVCR